MTPVAAESVGEDPTKEMVSDVRASQQHSNEDCQRESTPSLVRNNNSSNSSKYGHCICIPLHLHTVCAAYGAMTATNVALWDGFGFSLLSPYILFL